MTWNSARSINSSYLRESYTPLEKLKIDNSRLERERQLLINENNQLKETIRKLRIENRSLKSSNEKYETKCSRSLNKINEMNAAFTEMAQKNRNTEAEKNNIDLKRRELIRNRIDDEKQNHLLEKTVNSLSIKCIQHKTSDQEVVNKMTQDEKLIAEQERKIMKLKKENENLKEQLILANRNYNTTAIELKKKEKFSAKTQHDLNLKILDQEEELNHTLSHIKQVERQKEAFEEKIAKQNRVTQQLEISNQKMILNVHECTDNLKREKEVSHEKDLEIKKLQKEISKLKSVISQNSLQFDAFQKKIDTLQKVAYGKVQQREEDKSTPKFEKLRQKFVQLQESNKVLEDEISFLKGNNKLIKSQLNSQSATRVNTLLFQNEALRKENANLRNQLDESSLLSQIDEMKSTIQNLQSEISSQKKLEDVC